MSPVNTMPHHYPSSRGAMGFIPLSRLPAFSPVKQYKRRVSFAPTTARVRTVSRLSSTPEEKSNLYYNRMEMNGFYNEVKEFYLSHPDTRSDCPCSTCKQQLRARTRGRCLVGLETDPNIRGLELFFYPIRCKNKALTKKSVLKHYRDMKTDHRYAAMTEDEKIASLASVSSKLSYWSKMVAMETARLDSIRAYGDHPRHSWTSPAHSDDDDMSIKRRTVSFDNDDNNDRHPSKRRRL